MFREIQAYYPVTGGPLLKKKKKKTEHYRFQKGLAAATTLMHHLFRVWWCFSSSPTQLCHPLYQGNMLTERQIILSALGQKRKRRVRESQFFSFDPLRLYLLSHSCSAPRPTLSVGRRDGHCSANAPAGSLLASVSIFFSQTQANEQMAIVREATASRHIAGSRWGAWRS